MIRHSAHVDVRIKAQNGQVVGMTSAPRRSHGQFLRLSHLRRLKKCEKVAAVCYRVRPNGIQFLLVQTKKGRWTFPKGSVEPGLTHAQAAALEAFEEAGVHGRIEEAPFTHYLHYKWRNSGFARIKVSAHLCEVTRLEAPSEVGRNRTWFSAENTKLQVRERRKPDHGRELARVVDRALGRIQRLQITEARLPAKSMLTAVTLLQP